jgi:hypothetical protein
MITIYHAFKVAAYFGSKGAEIDVDKYKNGKEKSHGYVQQ